MKMFGRFRAISHLLEQLGEERFSVLIDCGNTEEVKEFCDDLLRDSKSELVIGDRTYEVVLMPSHGADKSGKVYNIIKWATEMDANLGEEDAQYLLDHQTDIPQTFRYKVEFVFAGWTTGSSVVMMNSVGWNNDRWGANAASLDCSKVYKRCRLLRRIK